MTRPRVRDLEPVPVSTPDGEMYYLRDPAGLADEIAVAPFTLLLLALMDGDHELTDIQAEVARRTGEILPVQQLEELIAQLDERHLMDSPAFAAHAAGLERAFLDSPVRPAAFAGRCYPEEAPEAVAELDAYFTHAEGPGAKADEQAAPVAALIAPHIDPPRGGPAYAHAYRALSGPAPDLVIVLGTSHMPTGAWLTFTRKSYRTSLGEVPTDTAALDALEARFGRELYTGEARHRAEHSIEFQMLWVRHRWPDAAFTALPVLCGTPRDLASGGAPEDDRAFAEVADRLAEIARGKRTLIVASADLAHVGPQFGDPRPFEEPERARVEREDREMLAPVLALDREGFRRAVWDAGDRNRICGFMPIYATLALLARLGTAAPGTLLAYRQWPDPKAVVTYTSIAFPASR